MPRDVAWRQIAQEEVPLLAEQAMDILRAEFPDLAKTYEPNAMQDPKNGMEPSL